MRKDSQRGKVYLVGAGPGDEGLLTLKGAEILDNADVVVYDRLVSAQILARIPLDAEKINVGKQVSNHPVPQEEINNILLSKAMENKLVVRLKGGDPFLFGRGGEELELLAQNNIPFEVIPGVTSAIAAAAYAGIPVTHRDFCSSLHVITGHVKKDGELKPDYPSLVKLNGTLVFMMSVSSMGEIANGLMQAGMDVNMPTAVIENGTRSNQRNIVSTISTIASDIAANDVKSPATIVVGKVCGLSTQFDWFSKLPLKGCRVVVTRPTISAGSLLSQLVMRGAEAIEYPCIKTTQLNFSIFLDGIDWLLFTSTMGVESFFRQLFENGMDCRALSGKKVATVGSNTAMTLMRYGIRPDFIPTVFDGEHMTNEMVSKGFIRNGDRAVIYRAKVGAEEICTILASHGIVIYDVAAYETEFIKNEAIDVSQFDYVTFTSASCVNGFVDSLGNTVDYTKINALCIGEQTAKAAKSAGMNTIVSDKATITSMLQKLEESYCHDKQTT